MIHKSSLHHGK